MRGVMYVTATVVAVAVSLIGIARADGEFIINEESRPAWTSKKAPEEIAIKKWMIGFEKEGLSGVEKLINELGGKIGKRFRLTSLLAVELPLKVGDDEKHPIIKKIAEHKHVKYIEKDHPRYALAEAWPYGVTAVQAPDTWGANDQTNAGQGRTVCVIDGGLDRNHEDLKDMWVANKNPYSEWGYNGCNHGNHVSGTISAVTGNNIGVVSVAPWSTQYIVRVFNGGQCDWLFSSGLIGAVEECVIDGNSHIISMSLGGPYFGQGESDTFDTVYWSWQRLPVAAAGNDGTSDLLYPASYNSVLSVAAVDWNLNRPWWSQFNWQVDISAPGVGVLSTTTASNGASSYAYYDGTSMACPHVSGVAALIWGPRTDLSPYWIRHCLTSTAKDRGTQGFDHYYGHGVVQAYDAFWCALRLFRSSSSANYVTDTDGHVNGMDTCQKSADGTVYKMTVAPDEDCHGETTEVTTQYFALMEDCESGLDSELIETTDSQTLVCDGSMEDGQQVLIKGWTVRAEDGNCDAIADESTFAGVETLLEHAVVVGVCANFQWEGETESYKWEVDSENGQFAFKLFRGSNCAVEEFVSEQKPPEPCQVAGPDNKFLWLLDSTIEDGTKVWLDYDISSVQDDVGTLPSSDGSSSSPDSKSSSKSSSGSKSSSSKSGSGSKSSSSSQSGSGSKSSSSSSSSSMGSSSSSSSSEDNGSKNVTLVVDECRDGSMGVVNVVNNSLSVMAVTIRFAPDINDYDASDLMLYVSVEFDNLVLDTVTISLDHNDKSATVMSRVMCEGIGKTLSVRMSDEGDAAVASFCSLFSSDIENGAEEYLEALSVDELDSTFEGEEMSGDWVVFFEDTNVNSGLKEKIGRVCVGARQYVNSQELNSGVNRIYFISTTALMMLVINLLYLIM